MSGAGHIRKRQVAAGAVLALWLGGCMPFGSGSTVPLPPAAPRGDRAGDRDHARLVAAFGGEVRAPATQRLLSEITGRLVTATERPDEAYQVTILNSPVVNAFALPNGRLYVTRGLLALANDTAEIAAVLSHEIAHVTLRHAVARTEERGTLGADQPGHRNGPQQSRRGGARARPLALHACELLAHAGARRRPGGGEGARPGRLRSLRRPPLPHFARPLRRRQRPEPAVAGRHARDPSEHRRAHRTRRCRRRAAASAPGIGESDRDRYLAAVDGIAYGDDPADGVVRGRRFIHGRLGVAFEAPEGFSLENTSQAVLGASADGNRRLLFDAATTPDGESLEEVLRTTWSDTIEPGSLATAHRQRPAGRDRHCRAARNGRSASRRYGSAARPTG